MVPEDVPVPDTRSGVHGSSVSHWPRLEHVKAAIHVERDGHHPRRHGRADRSLMEIPACMPDSHPLNFDIRIRASRDDSWRHPSRARDRVVQVDRIVAGILDAVAGAVKRDIHKLPDNAVAYPVGP